VNLSIDDAEFKVKSAEIKAQLDVLATKHPDIAVRVDATRALADIEVIKAELREIDGKTSTAKVKVDTGSSTSDVNRLLLAGLALGPAIIPVAAAVSAALAAIGTGAVMGVAALGTGMLAFHGVSDAVKAMDTAQQQAGANAASMAAQQISAANGIANAQDSLRTAITNVGVAQDNAARSIHQALEQEQAAHLAVGAAVRTEQNAEQSLIDVQHSALLAQEGLTQARVDAQRALQDMAFSVTDNALAQKRAQIDLQTAQTALTNIAATDPRRAGAELSVQESQQRLIELQTQGQRLATDKAAADAKGVEGSKQVTSAQDTLTQANQRVAAAQQAVIDSAQGIVTAQQRERDAVDAVTQAKVAGDRAIEAAQQSVVTSTRALESAQASAAAQAASTTGAQNALAQAMSKLTPSGQEFAHFIHDDLEPKVKGLQATAANGLLPGAEQGLKNIMPLLPEVDSLVGVVAHTLGDMAEKTGAALNSPFWRGFIEFIKGEASPSMTIFGQVLGNLATGGAAILMAFKPVWDQMGAGIKNWSDRFAEASKNLEHNPEFQKFLAYVHDNGPVVMHTIADVVSMFVKLGEALAPVGATILPIVDAAAKFVGSMPPEVLGPLVIGLWAISTAYQSMKGVTAILTAIKDATWLWTAAQAALDIAMLPVTTTILLIIGVCAILGLAIYEVVKHWQGLKDGAGKAIDGIKWAFGAFWDWIRPVFDGVVWAVNKIGEAFGGVRDWVRDHWHEIADLAKAPIQFVVDVVYNNGILPVWNGIAGVFGLHQLGPVRLAEGGVLPGYAPGRDTVPAMLSPGEGILVPEAVQGLGAGFVHWANRTFSAGRVTGGSGFADGGIVGDIAGVFTDPLGTLRNLFGGVLASADKIPGVGMLRDAMHSLPDKLIGAAVDKAKSLITSMASAGVGDFGGGAGVDRWSGVALSALALMQQPGSYLGITLRRMNQESGGNPTAVNRSDINWQHGTPSVGLMQVIGPTYAANKVLDRGPYLYGVSIDPMANILASMHYALGRYGSLPAAYNQAGGYANGGIVTGPTLAHIGEAGAEAVIPLTRPGRARAVMAQAGLGGATVNVGPVHLHSDVDVDSLAHRLAFASAAAAL
ncbi:MAG: transglycosylase SLT domain-containing protein, partial [Pseudonocardiaceae bacterium]